MEVSSGYLWAFPTVLIPIVLALAMLYASYRTWQYRKHTLHRSKRMPNEVRAGDAARVEKSARGIIVWSVVSCILLMAVLVIFFR